MHSGPRQSRGLRTLNPGLVANGPGESRQDNRGHCPVQVIRFCAVGGERDEFNETTKVAAGRSVEVELVEPHLGPVGWLAIAAFEDGCGRVSGNFVSIGNVI